MAVIADRLLVMNHGAVAMQGTSPEIFTHAEELAAMGLDVPQVNRVILALRHMGAGPRRRDLHRRPGWCRR